MLIAKVALNIKKGQTIYIESKVEHSYFANKCIDTYYDAGAGEVVMGWVDDYSREKRIEKATDETINNVPDYAFASKNKYIGNGASYLELRSENFSENKI